MTNNEQPIPFWQAIRNSGRRKPSTRSALRQSNQGAHEAMKGRTRNTAR